MTEPTSSGMPRAGDAPHGAPGVGPDAPGPDATGAPGAASDAPSAEDVTTEAASTDALNTEAVNDDPQPVSEAAPSSEGAAHPDTVLAAERLGDLQRLQAEYVNYKRRVDRDRDVIKERARHEVFEALLPVLDEIHLAREHGDLSEGPAAAMADKLEAVLGKHGLERFGAKGEAFDPAEHEALMNMPWPADDDLPADATGTTVVQVLQPGYRTPTQVLRAARVAVADPE